MVSSNIAVCSTVFSYCHNCSIAQGNRTKRSFNSGAPARQRRANIAPFFRKVRKPIKPRKFGYDVTVRASERTPSVQTLGEGAGRLNINLTGEINNAIRSCRRGKTHFCLLCQHDDTGG